MNALEKALGYAVQARVEVGKYAETIVILHTPTGDSRTAYRANQTGEAATHVLSLLRDGKPFTVTYD